jgi:hypothetical protein
VSRTYRRKGYEKTTKIPFQFYMKQEWYKLVETGTYHKCPSFVEMTKQEKDKWKLFIHGESRTANSWSPSWFYRKAFKQMQRRINGDQLRKCLNDNQYDPVFYENFPSQRRLFDWH